MVNIDWGTVVLAGLYENASVCGFSVIAVPPLDPVNSRDTGSTADVRPGAENVTLPVYGVVWGVNAVSKGRTVKLPTPTFCVAISQGTLGVAVTVAVIPWGKVTFTVDPEGFTSPAMFWNDKFGGNRVSWFWAAAGVVAAKAPTSKINKYRLNRCLTTISFLTRGRLQSLAFKKQNHSKMFRRTR